MAEEAKNGFDSNFNMRAFKADTEEFYKACKENGEPDGAKVVRRMMADYIEGNITYDVNQEDN